MRSMRRAWAGSKVPGHGEVDGFVMQAIRGQGRVGNLTVDLALVAAMLKCSCASSTFLVQDIGTLCRHTVRDGGTDEHG